MRFQPKYVALGTVCIIEKGATGIQWAIAGEYPLVTTGEERGSHNEYQFDGAAVCIPTISSTGHGHASLKRIHYQEGKFALGSILAACIPKDPEQLSARFLYIYLSINKDEVLVPLMKGTANVSLTLKSLACALIPLFPMEQQLQIIGLYNASTEAHKGLAADFVTQATLLTRLRQAVLREAVQGRIVPQDTTDEPAPALLARIRAEKQRLMKEKKLRAEKPLPPLGEAEVPYKVPAGWAWCRLGDVGTVKGGLQKSSKRKPIKNHYPYLRVANVQRGHLLLNEIERFELTSEELSSCKLEKGDLLIVEGNGSQKEIGRCAIWDGSITDCVHQNHIIRCRLLGSIDPQYLVSFLNSPSGKKQMVELAITSIGLYSLSVNKITQLVIPLPPLPEQRRIVAKVTELLAHCTALEAELQQVRQAAEALHAAALREAFSISSTQFA